MEQLRDEKRYTYADYCTWDDSGRWELIDGVAHAMAPAPSQSHQETSSELHRQIANFLKGKPCKVFAAPFDVKLNIDNNDDTVMQPDLLVVCENSKLDGKSCNGAPDLVIEILLPSTARRDRLVKFNVYQRAGVREYWIVDPDTNTVTAHLLENGKYTTIAYGDAGVAPVSVLPGCEINLGEVFPEQE